MERRALRVEAENFRRQAREQEKEGLRGLIGTSPAMQNVYRVARQVAGSRATVMITGESGTGKGELARAIHALSPRAKAPFISLHCAALAESLLESELFGHEKGSFTGADKRRSGRFEQADGGTLFLDEIGELPPEIQPKLLRLLEEREYERVGEPRPRSADVRLIAATNRQLAAEVAAGRFRQDLFYRLNVVSVTLPGLGDRPADLLRLADDYRRFFAERLAKKITGFSPAVAAAFAAYAWPGNLRELRNVVERAVILAAGPAIELADLPEDLRSGPPPVVTVGARVSLETLEAEHLRRVLALASNLDEAARILAIDPATLYRKRQRLGLL
jgi:NtrC-family two-component system response regulator AlgB